MAFAFVKKESSGEKSRNKYLTDPVPAVRMIMYFRLLQWLPLR